MNGVTALIQDLETSIAQGSGDQRVDTLRRVTDLFLIDAPALAEPQIDVFDAVILRLATAIETRARAQLAERLADVDNAPRGVIRSLAHDEISVAGPILSRSVRLTDDDLVSVAKTRGQEHMLAITERTGLSEAVTDVLVERGNEEVTHAVAGNLTARFSPFGFDRLVEKSRADAALQSLMTQRIDVPPSHMRSLVTIAKETARKRLAAALPASDARMFNHALDSGASVIETEVTPLARGNTRPNYDYDKTRIEIMAMSGRGQLNEARVAEFAQKQDFECCVCAIAALARIGIPTSERLFIGDDPDLLLIVTKALGWDWATTRALLKLRGDDNRPVEKAMASYDQLTIGTAQRVLRFLAVREASARSADQALSTRLSNART